MLENMTTRYSEKLRDPRWQKRRLSIMERDEFTCQECKAKDKPLNVHHAYYVKNKEPWAYPNWALVTLCDDCHKTANNYGDRERYHFEAIVMCLTDDAHQPLNALADALEDWHVWNQGEYDDIPAVILWFVQEKAKDAEKMRRAQWARERAQDNPLT